MDTSGTQLGAQAGQQAALDGEARFQGVQARMQVVDAALEAFNLVGVGADPGAHLSFTALRGGDPAFERTRGRTGGNRPEGRHPRNNGGEDDRERDQGAGRARHEIGKLARGQSEYKETEIPAVRLARPPVR